MVHTRAKGNSKHRQIVGLHPKLEDAKSVIKHSSKQRRCATLCPILSRVDGTLIYGRDLTENEIRRKNIYQIRNRAKLGEKARPNEFRESLHIQFIQWNPG